MSDSIKPVRVVGILPQSHKLSSLLSPATMSTLKLLSSINIYAFPSLISWNGYFGFFSDKEARDLVVTTFKHLEHSFLFSC